MVESKTSFFQELDINEKSNRFKKWDLNIETRVLTRTTSFIFEKPHSNLNLKMNLNLNN